MATILVAASAAFSEAQTLFSTGFESPGYSPGGLTRQNSWYTFGNGNAGNPQVQNTVVRTGSQAISVNASGAVGYSLHELTYSDSGANKIVEGSIQLNMASLGTSWNGLCFIGGNDSNPTVGCLSVSTFGAPFITNFVNPIVGRAVAPGTWNEFRLRLDFTAQTMTGFVNGNTIGTVPFRSAVRTLAAVGFGFSAIPGSNIAYFDDLSVSASAPSVPLPTFRSDQPLLQSFSGRPGLSSGTWVELYGTNLSTTTREWACADFTANCTQAPTSLDGVRVNINNRPAFVRYISPTQINAQVPDDGGATGPVQITVTNSLGTSAPITMNKTAESPALLTTPSFLVGGKQYVAALYSDNATFVGPVGLIAGAAFRPAKVGDVIIVYAVGCGATNPASPTGTVLAAPVPVAGTVRVSFGQTPAAVQAFVSALGLCQLNVTVPSVPSGDIAISASVNGTATGQTLFTTIQ